MEYKIPNVLGTFYTADFSAGRDFYNSELDLGLRKEFIRPTDYEIGLTYSDIKSKRYMVDLDTSLLVKVRNLDVWGGKSHYIRSIKSSVFLTGRYSYARFSRRPPVTADYNPRCTTTTPCSSAAASTGKNSTRPTWSTDSVPASIWRRVTKPSW